MIDNHLKQPLHPDTLKFVKKYVIRTLRRYWRYYPPRTEAIKRAQIDRGNYQCNICKQTGFSREQLQVDHIVPSQTLENGVTSWYDLIMFISRLFVQVDDLQTACLTCHEIKTKQENIMRKYYRDKKKQENKD